MFSKLVWQVLTMAENNTLTELEGGGQTPKGAQTVVLGPREVRPQLLGRWGWSRAMPGSSWAGSGDRHRGRLAAVPRLSSGSGGDEIARTSKTNQ